MKIENILSEDFTPTQTVAPLKFKDLNTLQIRTLKRIASGQVDVDTASEKEYDIMADLHDLGLLDDEYNLSQSGDKAVKIADKLGGSYELVAARNKQQALNSFDKRNQSTVDVNDDTDTESLDFSDDDDFGDNDEFDFRL
jgi:hypothetical protein